MEIIRKVLSFPETVELSKKAVKSVWMLRHSMRRSLTEGTLDPGLTDEGRSYAQYCGTLLSGLDDVSFGSSGRLRCIETVKAIAAGGNYDASIVKSYPVILDYTLFTSEDALGRAINENRIPALIKQYYSTGNAPDMVPLAEYSARLLAFLTETDFAAKNTILSSHDIIVVSLLLSHKVYPFVPDDWCGYVHGAVLFLQENGTWQLAYTAPEGDKRRRAAIFV